MMTSYHNKLFLNISHVVCLFFFVNDAAMTHPYNWTITELTSIKIISYIDKKIIT